MAERLVMVDHTTDPAAEALLDRHDIEMALAPLGAEWSADAGPWPPITGGALDSRVLRPGEIFFALPGEHVHGARFVVEALARGAALAIVARGDRAWVPDAADPRRVVWVDDAQAALTALGRTARARARDLTVIGVTGSYGKTTTKDMIAAVLAPAFPVHRTPGNYNNHLGVPLTLLGLKPEHRAAVIELGMNAPGEIATLAALAAPRLGVVTGIGRAHLAGLGSKAAIIAAKLELTAALGPHGLLVIPADDPDLLSAAKRTGVRLLTVGTGSSSVRPELAATSIAVNADGVSFQLRGLGLDGLGVTLPVPGRVLVLNALLALAVGATLGVPSAAMVAALAQIQLPARRFTLRRAGDLIVLDDCYNANPESMAAALTMLGELAVSRRIGVLGDMRELGDITRAAHTEVGDRAGRVLDRLYVIGDEAATMAAAAREAGMASTAIVIANDRDALARQVVADLAAGDGILVKASRALGLEVVVDSILAAEAGRAADRETDGTRARSGA